MNKGKKNNSACQLRLVNIIQLAVLVLSLISCAQGIESASWRWRPRQKNPPDSLVKVYLFNVTNPEETINGNAPILAEVGPYVYRERRTRFNISTTLMNTVKFQENKTYEFLPELSKGSENDVINFVNIPFISAIAQLYGVPFMGPTMIDTLVKQNETIIRQDLRVGDLLYDGIDVQIYLPMLKTLGQSVPPQMAEGKFGLFKGKNGTDDGQIEVQEAVDFLHNIGDVVSWKNMTVLNYWQGSKCNKIAGTDGTVFHPDIKTDSALSFYNPELCRSLDLVYEKNADVNSVAGYKFIFPDYLLEDPEVHDANTCYCKDYDDLEEDYSVCLKKGVIDLSACREGAPLVSSYPHFLDADPMYGEKVKGLNPQRELHQSFVIVEPKTGSVLSSSIKFQLNVRMTPLSNVKALGHIPDYLFPAMWIDKSFTLDEEASSKLNSDKDMDNVMDVQTFGGGNSDSNISQGQSPGHGETNDNTKGEIHSQRSHATTGVFYPATAVLIALGSMTIWMS